MTAVHRLPGQNAKLSDSLHPSMLSPASAALLTADKNTGRASARRVRGQDLCFDQSNPCTHLASILLLQNMQGKGRDHKCLLREQEVTGRVCQTRCGSKHLSRFNTNSRFLTLHTKKGTTERHQNKSEIQKQNAWFSITSHIQSGQDTLEVFKRASSHAFVSTIYVSTIYY